VRQRQRGWERTGTRMDPVRERALSASLERMAQRYREQKPVTGSDVVLREWLGRIAAGAPDYPRMKPAFADQTRQQLAGLQKFVANFGTLRNLQFHAVTPEGSDQFDADFEKGGMRVDLRMSDDGLIEDVGFMPR
jgi:hypothetical protein